MDRTLENQNRPQFQSHGAANDAHMNHKEDYPGALNTQHSTTDTNDVSGLSAGTAAQNSDDNQFKASLEQANEQTAKHGTSS